jgi:pilus assembly protein Flp/PilA
LRPDATLVKKHNRAAFGSSLPPFPSAHLVRSDTENVFAWFLIRDFIMVKCVTSFLRDESGASAAEYALILAIIGTGIAAASFALGGAISDAMGSAEDCIDSASALTGTSTSAPNC